VKFVRPKIFLAFSSNKLLVEYEHEKIFDILPELVSHVHLVVTRPPFRDNLIVIQQLLMKFQPQKGTLGLENIIYP